MTTVSPTAGTAATASTANASATLAKNFSSFLTLLTTQLQNQDPLDPMNSNEFTSQLVQFSQVEQSINTNNTLSSMLSVLQGATTTNAVSYIGKQVVVDTPTAAFDGSTPVTWRYGNDGTAVTTVLQVLDAKGSVVRTLTSTESGSGKSLTWDGKTDAGNEVAAGSYTLRATAVDKNGKSVATTIGTVSTVTGVETSDGIINLITKNGSAALDKVSGIYG
ncbi:flagellar hook assembly protein FlgD [Zavarzinia compransoris]|uniref:Basal-body rod modification protein FlgD n=1 Tax=Zavarzinia compransoris TaxID=1264899 RepID=A0A317EAC9_9PROT|nr:flagellar hook capping FlgD N-terminal domain-containing protein [Zavarzinia compransoris]PWR22263.1 flagellar hook capping protein [Zavarzinia compransoris]TDP46976.1 flagellar basal-body rod modification protein FlgD [Zavarzinia compransoris]